MGDFVCTSGKPNRELLPQLTPEEMKEDQPDPTPSLPQVLPEAVAGSDGLTSTTPEAPAPQAQAAAVSQSQESDAQLGLPEGLRQRHSTTEGASNVAAAPAPAAAAPAAPVAAPR